MTVQRRCGMAIPMALGVIMVAAILGMSLWLAGRAGTNRTSHSFDIVQRSHLAQAGITEGFARIKFLLRKGKPLATLETPSFALDVPIGRRTGLCEVQTRRLREGEFELRSQGRIVDPSSTARSDARLTLQAKVTVQVELVRRDDGRLMRHYRCRLHEQHRVDSGPSD